MQRGPAWQLRRPTIRQHPNSQAPRKSKAPSQQGIASIAADLWEDSRASPEGCADSWGRVRRGSWLHDAMRASFLMAMPATCTVHALPLLFLLLPGPAVAGRHGLLLRRMVARSVSVARFMEECCGVESQAAFPLSSFTPTPHRYGQGVFLAKNQTCCHSRIVPCPRCCIGPISHQMQRSGTARGLQRSALRHRVTGKQSMNQSMLRGMTMTHLALPHSTISSACYPLCLAAVQDSAIGPSAPSLPSPQLPRLPCPAAAGGPPLRPPAGSGAGRGCL